VARPSATPGNRGDDAQAEREQQEVSKGRRLLHSERVVGGVVALAGAPCLHDDQRVPNTASRHNATPFGRSSCQVSDRTPESGTRGSRRTRPGEARSNGTLSAAPDARTRGRVI